MFLLLAFSCLLLFPIVIIYSSIQISLFSKLVCQFYEILVKINDIELDQ